MLANASGKPGAFAMATIEPRKIFGQATGADDLEPLVVSPRQACLLLGVGNTRLYQLIGAGELEAYHEGRARRITMRSIRERVTRLAAKTESQAAMDRRPSRPRKHGSAVVTP
jgi:excisionase family DNA binding protein